MVNNLTQLGYVNNYDKNCYLEKISKAAVDLVNDNVYTKIGLNQSICFQDIEQKLNSDVNQGP